MTQLPLFTRSDVPDPGGRPNHHVRPRVPQVSRRTYEVPLPMDDTLVLTHGVIDRDAEYGFTNGQCHAFALALHHHTGWPLGKVDDRDWVQTPLEPGRPEHWNTAPVHHFVYHPTGAVADIHGLHDPRDFAEAWDAHEPEQRRHPLHPLHGGAGLEHNLARFQAMSHEQRHQAMAAHYRPYPKYGDYPPQHQLTSETEAGINEPPPDYLPPHMESARSMVDPWLKTRASHWQPRLPVVLRGGKVL